MLPLIGYLKGKTASHLKEIPVANGMKSQHVSLNLIEVSGCVPIG